MELKMLFINYLHEANNIGYKNAITQLTSSVSTGSLGTAGNLINQLKQPGASLQALAGVGLSAAAASQLSSSISALSSGGAVQIKMPIVGINTINRTDLTSQLVSVFGSSKIPIPNYGGNPATTGDTPSTEKLVEKLKEQTELTNKTIAKVEETRNARLAFSKARHELPAGDPQIEELRIKWYDLVEELKSLTTVA